jgi:hypothetical protein
MTLRIAPKASGHNVLAIDWPALRTRLEMFSRALHVLGKPSTHSMHLDEAPDVTVPNRLRTVEAAALLLLKCLPTKFLEFAGHETST